jgi:hypothetical protein
MERPRRRTRQHRLRRTTVAAALLAALPLALLSAQSGAESLAALTGALGPLSYARGFLLTGNYLTAGTTSANGTIQMSGFPAKGDVAGAFLYWETIHSASNPHPEINAKFLGQAVPTENLEVHSFPLTGNTATCWGAANQVSEPVVSIFRADVMSLLRKRFDNGGNWTGKYNVNGAYQVNLPDGGSGNLATQSGGGTLVVVFSELNEPLRKIVIFDGAYRKPENTTFSQSLPGFYQSTGPKSRLTYLAGVGGVNSSETMYLGTAAAPPTRSLPFGTPIATDPFKVAQGSGRTWNTVTIDLPLKNKANTVMPGFSDPTYGEYVTTTVQHAKTTNECVAVGSVIFSTQVLDNDNPDPDRKAGFNPGDGIPDGLELNTPKATHDPNDVPLPDLYGMGARANQQDLLMELVWMKTPPGEATTYGFGSAEKTDADGHTHRLSLPNVVKLGQMYGAQDIHAHFDVGDPAAYKASYIAECPPTEAVHCQSQLAAADPYLVQTGWRGGEEIIEKACADCQFKEWPGTVSWPLGAQLIRDAPVGDNGEELEVSDLPKWAAKAASCGPEGGDPISCTTQRRRFDFNRRDYVRLIEYIHGRGKAKSDFPCLDPSTSPPTPKDYNNTSARTCDSPFVANEDFYNLRSLSGQAKLPGNLAMISLGLWDNFTGTEFVQGSTTAHEAGHFSYLWHGGGEAIFGDSTRATSVEPNCKPNYSSIMSYSLQAIGQADADGNYVFDYSNVKQADLVEGALPNTTSITDLYLPVWYVQLPASLAASQGTPPAQRFCSGKRFDPAAPQPAPPTVQWARVEADDFTVSAPSITSTVEWDGGGTTTHQDVNFDGQLTTLKGFNDWANLRLDQIGGGLEFSLVRSLTNAGSGGELFIDASSGGELFLDASGGNELTIDLGSGIELAVDAGGGGELLYELGGGGELFLDASGGGELFLELGGGGELFLDLSGGGELFLDLSGGGELVLEAAGGGEAELAYDTALAIGRAAPQNLTACVIGVDCPTGAPTTPLHRTYLTWKPPTFGTVAFYRVYRKIDDPAITLYTEISGAGEPTTSFVDTEELPNGRVFLYRVRAEYDDGIVGPASNIADITATNNPPLVVDDPPNEILYVTPQGVPLSVPAASGVLVNDTDPDSATIVAIAGVFDTAAGGSVTLSADGSFTYTPPNATFTGTDTFTYKANNGTWAGPPTGIPQSADSEPAATVTITVQLP